MKSIKLFNNLHNETVSREHLQNIYEIATHEEQPHIAHKIKEILSKYPEGERFEFSISEKEMETLPTSFLAGVYIDDIEEDDEPLGLGKAVTPEEIYKMITRKMIDFIKKASTSDYKKEWGNSEKEGFLIPINFDTKKPYKGINQISLKNEFTDSYFEPMKNPYFLTFKQIQKHKGKLKKGSKGCTAIYYSPIYKVGANIKDGNKSFQSKNEKEVEEFCEKHDIPVENITKYLMLKYYNVFNGEDIEGIDFGLEKLELGKVRTSYKDGENRAAKAIVRCYPKPAPEMGFSGSRAYYNPVDDFIRVPPMNAFDTEEDFFRTLFHEMIHSTGSKNRLDRKLSANKKDKKYAFEELVAEFGAVFLSAQAGIIWHNTKNHAAYIKGWKGRIKTFEDDEKLLMRAAAYAQKATDFILNLDKNGKPAFYKELLKPKTEEEKPQKEPKKVLTPTELIQKRIKEETKNAKNHFSSDLVDNVRYNVNYNFVYKRKFFVDNDADVFLKIENAYIYKGVVSFKKYSHSSQEFITPKQFAKLKIGFLIDGVPYFIKKNDTEETFFSEKYHHPTVKKPKKEPKKVKGAPDFTKDLPDVETHIRSFHNLSFKPDVRASEEAEEWQRIGEMLYKPINEVPQKHKEAYMSFFEKTYKNLLKKKLAIISSRFGAINTAVTGPAGVKSLAQKRTEAYHKKQGEFYAYIEHLNDEGIKKFIKKLSEEKSTAKSTLELLYEKLAKEEAKKTQYKESDPLRYNRAVRNIRQIKKDIARLEGAEKSTEIEGVKVVENAEENRLQIFFDFKPSEELRQKMKKSAFKWSPRNKCWQRQLTANALTAWKKIAEDLQSENYTPALNAPSIDTAPFKKMSVRELREYTLNYYNTYLKGDKALIKKHLKEVIFTTKAGRKIAKGEAMYSAKASAVEHLKELIENSTYNNWGDRKKTDSKDVIGYLNFKSKLTIDGEKRHVRISLTMHKDRSAQLKNIEVGKKKASRLTQAPVAFLQDEEAQRLFKSKNKTKNEKTKKKENFFSLGVPMIEKAEQEPTRPLNVFDKMNRIKNTHFEYFNIEGEVSEFLGKLEKKRRDSLVITIGGAAGSGKTQFAFQFINALAQNYKVGHASIEEHPESKLYFDKVRQYLNDTAMKNTQAPEINTLEDLHKLITDNDVIIIDSFEKLREIDPNFQLDKDLRKKYDGKLFLIVYQLTVNNKMRGGAKSEFDGDIILQVKTFADYRENFVFPQKNRYNATPAHLLMYNIHNKALINNENGAYPLTENNNIFDVYI